MAIMVAVFSVVAIILLAFVIDRGRVYIQRAALQDAVDAAALAAVQATCLSPVSDPSVVRQLAVDYGASNGVTIQRADVTIQDDPAMTTAGVSVAAQTTIPQVFGGFASVQSATVAARATATRSCTLSVQMVGQNLVDFNGGKSTGGNIYSQKCFQANGNNGTFASISVSTLNGAGGAAGCAGADPIDEGNNTVGSKNYGVPVITVQQAYAGTTVSAGSPEATIAGYVTTCTGVPSAYLCDTGSIGGAQGLPSNSSLLVIANGSITGKNNDTYTGPLIYSKTGDITLKAGLGANTVVYAPNGTITFDGGQTDVPGILIGQSIVFRGGSQQTSYSATIRSPGPWKLTQ